MSIKTEYALEAHALVKNYEGGLIPAVKGASLRLKHERIYALMGPSGCGKSTLLNLIGTLDTAENGTVLYEGKKVETWRSLAYFRREYIGFVFQSHHLLPVLTLRENVETALLFRTTLNQEQPMQERVKEILEEMGLAHRMDALASNVSGGERQRTAIARALVSNPRLILADEPTGNVDSETSERIMRALRKRISQTGATALIATHDPNVSAYADTLLLMKDGKIEAIENANSVF